MDLRGVTVVLPALDEAAALPVALASFPPGVDLLVVDNGSFDGTDLAAVAGPVLGSQADLVVGSRTTGARQAGAMTAFAVAANRALGLTCRLLFGIPLSDLGPFRAIRRDTLLALGIRDRGQGWPLEMIGRAGRAGLRVVEVPVRYRPRAGGASKVSGSLRGSLRVTAAMAAVTCRLLAERLGTRARPAAPRPPAATRIRRRGR